MQILTRSKQRSSGPAIPLHKGRRLRRRDSLWMGITNFLLTATVIGSAAFLLTGDVRKGAANLRRNARAIRGWLEEAEQSNGMHNETPQSHSRSSHPSQLPREEEQQQQQETQRGYEAEQARKEHGKE